MPKLYKDIINAMPKMPELSLYNAIHTRFRLHASDIYIYYANVLGITLLGETMKHTSICLNEELHAKILSTGKPINAIIKEALENYFSGVQIGKDKVKEEYREYLKSEEMAAFFKSEIKEAIKPYIGLLIVNGNSKIPSYGNEISPGILKTFPFCCSGLIMHLGSI